MKNLEFDFGPKLRDFEKSANFHQNFDENQRSSVSLSDEGEKRDNIILCACLIDKTPNLAGLTKTCEILNAQALLFETADVMKLPEYKEVTLGAERKLPIYEVKETDLYDYLVFQKKFNGYKILGVEQTADSKLLHHFKEKVVDDCQGRYIILLGKEKEGIPQEYLDILDECVEIP